MERFVDDAVVLSSVDYGEADRIVTLFTRAHGRLSAFAAGARKSKRRFAGALEVGTHLKASLVSRRGDTFRLDSVDVVRSFHRLSQKLPLIARALYCLELCRELTRDHQPHEALFDGLTTYLAQLDEERAGPTSLIKFELDALQYTGFMPSFGACARCGKPVGSAPRFDPQAGGVACATCMPVARQILSGAGRRADAAPGGGANASAERRAPRGPGGAEPLHCPPPGPAAQVGGLPRASG